MSKERGMSDSGFEIVREFNVDLIGLLNLMPIAMEVFLYDPRIQKFSIRKQLKC